MNLKMPYHIIKYKLPDEREDLNTTLLASEYHSALWEIDQFCRGVLKHGNGKENLTETLERVRELASVVHRETI